MPNGHYDDSVLQPWQAQQENPAVPAGVQQGAAAAEGAANGNPRYQDSVLAKWIGDAPGDYIGAAQTWYTGANKADERNGWSDDFWAKAMEQTTRLTEEGRLLEQFDDPKATGVVMWDHQSADKRHDYHFGDVFENGQRVANLYDQFDKNTANLMMADFALSRDAKTHIFSDSDPMSRLDNEISDFHAAQNENYEKFLSSSDFNEKVDTQTENVAEGKSEWGVLGGAAAGGAALGAGIGSIVPGVGTAIGAGVGAGIGAAVGGIGGWLNRDALNQQAARAYEITAMSTRENGTGAGLATGLSQWSGFGGKLISPLSNLTQGIDDAVEGRGGDNVSEFYKLDKSGKSQTPWMLKGADVVAAIGDSALQFSNPIGAGLFTAQMAGTITGESAELALTGGKTFDYTRGGFDNIFTDDDGNFRPDMALAGIGKVGIDVVQLGMARGLMGKADTGLEAVGGAAVYRTGALGMRSLTDRLPKVLGGIGSEGRAALAAGGTRTPVLAGNRWILDAEGNAIKGSRTKALSFLAPSEQLQSLSARVIGMRAAAARGGAMTTDDVYRGALHMATGESKWTMALVNGFGEGYEEAVQSVLQPYSNESSISMSDIGNAAIYGFAGGFGMSAGTGLHMVSGDQRMFAQAQIAHRLYTGGAELTRAEYDAMPETRQRALAALSKSTAAVAEAAAKKATNDQAKELTAGFVGVHKLMDSIQQTRESGLNTGTLRTDAPHVIEQLEDAGRTDADGNVLFGSWPADAAVTSALQLSADLVEKLSGFSIQRDQVAEDLKGIDQALKATPTDEALLEKQAEITTQLRQLELTLEWGRQIDAALDAGIRRLYPDQATGEAPAYAEIEAGAEAINVELREWFNEQRDVAPDGVTPLTPEDKRAISNAIAAIFTRQPWDSPGSFQILVPQISAKLTAANANGVLQVSHALLPATRGDYDGDKFIPTNQLIFDDEAYLNARSGDYFVGMGTSVNVKAQKFEEHVLGYLFESLSSTNLALANYAEATLQQVAGAVRRRYTGVVDARVLDEVLEDFFAAAHSGDAGARKVLIDGLAQKAGTQIRTFARSNLSNEWLWLDQLIASSMDAFQEGYAAHRPPMGIPNTTMVAANTQSADVKSRQAEAAATTGVSMGLLLAGDTPFRQFQKLHYTSETSGVISAEERTDRPGLYSLVEAYRALSSGASQAELDRIRSSDDITGRVILQLERLANEARRLDPALSPVESMVQVASIKVLDFEVDSKGVATSKGHEISMAQMLLKLSVQADRRAKDSIFDSSPDLIAKHNRLLGMTRPQSSRYPVNAERAFVEVFGSQQFYTLLGSSSAVFGPHLTLEQWVRSYSALDETQRAEEDRKLRGEAAYLGRKQSKNQPYDVVEFAEGDITAYRAVVDALVAVGHNRVTIDRSMVSKALDKEHRHLKGELANRSYDFSERFGDVFKSMSAALQEYLLQDPRRDNETDREVVRRLLQSYPDVYRQVLDLIPNSSAFAVIAMRDGEAVVSNWVFDMFLAKDADQAEMIYYRNLLLAELNALGISSRFNEEETQESHTGRQFSKLPRRMHRVVHNLAMQADGGLMLKEFLTKLEMSGSTEEFMRWVNTMPGVRGPQAPLTAWADDVADFDADKAGGGWSKSLSGVELREALTSLERGSTSLVKELAEEKAAVQADNQLIYTLDRVEAYDAGDTSITLRPGERELHQKFQATLNLAAEYQVGMGPAAMVYQTVFAASMFYGNAAAKGVNPDNVALAGMFEALRDAFGYSTNFERVLSSLTSVDLDSVGQNLTLAAQDDLRAMDDEGREVTWSKPSVKAMLELLKRPDTRAMARAVLFPQVMERDYDGALRPKLLVGKSLQELIEGTGYKNLYAKDDYLSHDAAYRYVSMVEATARSFGGNFAVQRSVNDYVIARTAAADHTLTIAEIEKLTLDAYYQVAQVLQDVVSFAPGLDKDGNDPLDDLLVTIKRDLRLEQTAHRMNLLPGRRDADANPMRLLPEDEQKLTDQLLDQLIAERKQQNMTERQRILDLVAAATDKAERKRLLKVIDNLDADEQKVESRLDLLRTDDTVAQVVTMYGLPKTEAEQGAYAGTKSDLVEYVMDHLDLLQHSSSSLNLLNKITMQVRDLSLVGQVKLEAGEWEQLSNSVIAVVLDDLASISAPSVSVPPFPDADRPDHRRYYDPTFTYLLEPWLKADSPIVQAARKIHGNAGFGGLPASKTEMDLRQTLDKTIFADFNFGAWTSDIPKTSIAANERLDSAAAAPAMSIYGNPPKTQAVISAATRRTFRIPEDSLATTAQLTWDQLGLSDYDDVAVTMPTGPTTIPLAQLNNRFARSVMFSLDGQDFDLLAEDDNLGRPFLSNAVAAASGLQEISVDRLRRSMERIATRLGVHPSSGVVSVAFFHPDSQPAEVEGEKTWYNNLFFEGGQFALNGDHYDSLNSGLWFAFGGISPAGQANAIEASKLGQPAMKVIPTPPAVVREAIEANFRTEFAQMLRAKTRLIMETDFGFGKLDPESYNAVYKNVKLRHFVRYTDETGKAVLLTAEQAIAAQAAGTALPPDAALWTPSDTVLRSMLGEQGTQGVERLYGLDLEMDLAKVETYRGLTERMVQSFALGFAGETVDLQSTRVAHRARQAQLEVRPMLTDTTRDAFDQKMRYFHELQNTTWTARAELPANPEGFNARRNMEQAMQYAGSSLQAENISLDWADIIPFVGPRVERKTKLSSMLLHELAAVLTPDGSRTGWVYREGHPARAPQGELSEVSLNEKAPAYRVTPGDLVTVELDSFNDDDKLARRRIDHFTQRGAIVILVDSGGASNLRAQLGMYLESKNYERLVGSEHVYRPREYSSRYQNLKARASTLMETRGIASRSMVSILNLFDKRIGENSAWINSDNPRLSEIAVTLDLVSIDFMRGFNVPVDSTDNDSQMTAVREHLRRLDTPEGRALLLDQSNGWITDEAEREAADEAFLEAFRRMLNRFDQHPGTVLPQKGDEFGTGDLIPLVDTAGRVLLYRHGFKAPESRQAVEEMAAQPREGSLNPAMVSVFPSKTQPNATTHTGTVVQVKPRSGYGLSIEMNIPLQQFGEKMVLEWNGMKYLLTPRPGNIALPGHGFFREWGVDMVAGGYDLLSKESFEGLVNNHRNAFAFFGINFLPDVAKFFRLSEPETKVLLQVIATKAPPLTIAAANEMIQSAWLTPDVQSQLLEVPGLLDRLDDLVTADTVEAQIARAMVLYLMVPGARVEDVLTSGGFNDTSTSIDAQSVLMPQLFTQFFDRAPLGSPLRVEINKRLNEQIYNPNTDGTGYHLSQTFQFEVLHGDASKNLSGFLQFAEAHSSGDNPIKNQMAYDSGAKTGVSQHSAAIAYQATGARTPLPRKPAKALQAANPEGHIEDFTRDQLDGGVWRLLNNISPKDREAGALWRGQSPAEAEARSLARDVVKTFRYELEKTKDEYWSERETEKYTQTGQKILARLGLNSKQSALVDYWVRQILGQPYGVDDNGEREDHISGAAAIEAAEEILANVNEGYLPVASAEVPQMHAHDVQLLYRINSRRTDSPWAPRESMSPDSPLASTWDEWVEVALGAVYTADNQFDPLYRLAVDGFMHTYQNATRSLLDLPVSVDSLVAQKLMDPQTSAMLISLDPNSQVLAENPVLADTLRISLDDLIGGRRVEGKYRSVRAPASAIAKRRNARRKWRKENGTPIPVEGTLKDMRKNGARYIHDGTNTNALTRMLINLRVGTALLNPALYVSMGPEQWVRGTLDRTANLLTGQSTAGKSAEWAAKAGLSRYTPEQITKLRTLYSTLGQRNDFKAMVYRDLMFLRPFMPGISRVEKWLESYARLGAHMQDPTWGIRADTLARRYVDAVLQHILATPTLSTETVDTVVAHLSTDPEYFKTHMPEAHQAGTNAIAQIRSLKQTPISLALKGIYEPLSASENAGVNFFSNLLLKLPLLFSGYAANVATSITGLQGLSDMTAVFLHGRTNGFKHPTTLLGRVQASLAGREISPDDSANFDMSSVMEGIDLSRSFIRGGLTHTGLFMFGMMASGLGLSGEDEETKKRRRMAKLQGAPFLYDPRALENDFRNQDAIFLDWLPAPLEGFFNVPDEMAEDGTTAVAQLNWTLKQFISPVMGMEKFFETGDFRQVTWGFQDAIGSFPLINGMMWDGAVSTAHELAAAAKNEEQTGTPGGLMNASWFLANVVGTYERMLFENAFVNQIYVMRDKYDRDPYRLPLTDSDGTLQLDVNGDPRRQNLGMEQYIDPESGEVLSGYVGRDTSDGILHALTENRLSLATFMWILPGTDTGYFRSQMPPKLHMDPKTPVSRQRAEAIIRALSGAEGGQPRLSEDELAYAIKGEAIRTGNWDMYNNLNSLVEQGMAKMPDEALSVLDERGYEVLTKSGAHSVFRGLAKGSVQIGDLSLQGIYIPYEMRDEIQTEWTQQLYQEGLDLGLDPGKATSRMKRLWGGPYGDSSTQGIGDILWLKPEDGGIPYDKQDVYKQLNTTYVQGPDGWPWATGFTRGGWMAALGVSPVKRAWASERTQDATGTDQRMNTTNLLQDTNTGLRALELTNKTLNIPTDIEISKSIIDAIEKAATSGATPYTSTASDGSGGGSGWTNYGGYGYGGYGGYGGGGGYSSSGYFTRMYSFPESLTPYANELSSVYGSNPLIRRADVRRERVWSERGRLKQWQ